MREKAGEKWDFKILELDDVNLITAKLIDEQPVITSLLHAMRV